MSPSNSSRKFPAAFKALKEAGIITVVPGKTVKMGYYPPHPIVNIHVQRDEKEPWAEDPYVWRERLGLNG